MSYENSLYGNNLILVFMPKEFNVVDRYTVHTTWIEFCENDVLRESITLWCGKRKE